MRSALIAILLYSVCFGAAQIDSLQLLKIRSDSCYIVAGKFDRLHGKADSSTIADSTKKVPDTLKVKAVYSIKDTAQYGVYDSVNIHKYLRFDTLTQHPGNGSLWNDVQHRALTSWTNGMEGVLTRVIFDACNSPFDSNSTGEVSIKGYDSTDANIPDSLSANFFKKFKMLFFDYRGTYTTKTAPAGTMILRLKMNAVVVCSTIVTLDPSETDNSWILSGTIVCRDIGATGKLAICTSWNHGQTSGASNIMHMAPFKTIRGGATVNTTIKLKPDITVQFSSATVNSIYVCSGFWLERH